MYRRSLKRGACGKTWGRRRAAFAERVCTPQRCHPSAPATDVPRMQPRRMSRRAFLGGAVAASAAWMVLRPPMRLWPSLSDIAADYRTATGEQRDIELGMDLVLHMNTQTSVNLRKTQGQITGLDLLAGEIQIRDTSSNHLPFTVFAGNGRIEVGEQTRCNIRCFGSDIQVTGMDGTSTLSIRGAKRYCTAAQRANSWRRSHRRDHNGGCRSHHGVASARAHFRWPHAGRGHRRKSIAIVPATSFLPIRTWRRAKCRRAFRSTSLGTSPRSSTTRTVQRSPSCQAAS
jgi:ferric-dicitrate binding protein FerR (iron transport regulator)